MKSTLTWIDHDREARERSLRILALFQEKESRDEMGLGGVRDSFSDLLFPGTSTIQTRLRYMLIVPWVYQYLEERETSASDFPEKARKLELSLVEPLLENEDRSGVFGKTAGKSLKRLPSSVYWSGLGAWGIRKIDASQDEYHRQIAAIYRLRYQKKSADQVEDDPDSLVQTWHPNLPVPPTSFPKELNLALTKDEAHFIRDCIVNNCKGSLIAHLALNCEPADALYPWEHPDRVAFSSYHMEILHHGRLFSEVMHGTSILYNLMLAEMAMREELESKHRENYVQWVKRLNMNDVNGWSLERLWELTLNVGHTITQRTRQFVETWIGLVLESPESLLDNTRARMLIREREKHLKKNHSRFTNERAREQWSGYAGMRRLDYRWSNVKTLLKDLHDGLNSQ